MGMINHNNDLTSQLLNHLTMSGYYILPMRKSEDSKRTSEGVDRSIILSSSPRSSQTTLYNL